LSLLLRHIHFRKNKGCLLLPVPLANTCKHVVTLRHTRQQQYIALYGAMQRANRHRQHCLTAVMYCSHSSCCHNVLAAAPLKLILSVLCIAAVQPLQL
jgi:hypothetical protein